MFRIHPQIENALDNGTTPFHGNPSIPDSPTPRDLAMDEFNRLVQRFERLEFQPNLPERQAAAMWMGLMREVAQLEGPHREALNTLAERIVRETLNIGDDELSFVFERFRIQPQHFQMQAGGGDDDYEALQQAARHPDFRDHVHKRRIVNSLIQGAAHHFQDLFYLYDEDVKGISPQLAEKYPLLMALSDRPYWTMAPMTEDMGVEGGLMKLDLSTKPLSVIVKAANLPVLLHEMGKGVLEALSLHSLPENEALRKAVLRAADKPNLEAWDLRVGPAMWRQFLAVFEPREAALKNETYRRFVALPVDDFHAAASELLEAHGKQALRATRVYAIKEAVAREQDL